MSAPDANGWMPIETAPKGPLSQFSEEGPTILLFGGYTGSSARTGHWKAKKTNAWCDTALGRTPKHPTHWQHLPKPPITHSSELSPSQALTKPAGSQPSQPAGTPSKGAA